LKAIVYLAQGDLTGARAVIGAVSREVDPTELVAFLAAYQDLYWVLDDAQQRLLLRLSPAGFNNNRASWGLALAGTHALRGDQARARAYGDSARLAFEAQLREAPRHPQLHALLGVALAYLGERARAIREGKRGVSITPVSKDALFGAYNEHQLVRIYLLVGDPEKALDHLEPLLKVPYFLSPGWLRIDPMFDPLRANPRFQRLVNGS
jgi:tetratricopeptide (TPR) repeat protein